MTPAITDAPALSPREKQVAALVARGHANKEIAAQLHLTEETVKVYVCKIRIKLRVDNRVKLALLWARQEAGLAS